MPCTAQRNELVRKILPFLSQGTLFVCGNRLPESTADIHPCLKGSRPKGSFTLWLMTRPCFLIGYPWDRWAPSSRIVLTQSLTVRHNGSTGTPQSRPQILLSISFCKHWKYLPATNQWLSMYIWSSPLWIIKLPVKRHRMIFLENKSSRRSQIPYELKKIQIDLFQYYHCF